MKGKHIVLGITGSIAAYKACQLVRLLVKEGAEVQAVMTPAAKEFVSPLTLATLTQKPVVSEFFDRRDGSWHSHVDLGRWADLMLIAPATASTLAKMATGVADNMLVTTYLSMKAPVMVAPAMDLDMFAHPATQENLATLRRRGVIVVEPATGQLASGLEGKGRMEEPENIAQAAAAFFARSGKLAGKRVLITAGPTYEKLDPVRFIGNFSTGKMGFALAEACAARGASVELVAGPVALTARSPRIRRTDVVSAGEMLRAAEEIFPGVDAAILCAAVADFTPEREAAEKIKRGADGLTLSLRPTADIAARLGEMRREGQVLAGFALETCDEAAHAREKLLRKHLDFIVLNSLRDEGAGFGHDTNKISIITADGQRDFPLKSKREAADDITDQLCSFFEPSL
ncbi:MAG: bifunctional phosphopantothenoylcysteine decarboxylase/phosphopantothenate--cysteine ligase CoaBC [Alloprevotella sp.]|nr:bifunctional phosphopantothenoylcysteine decarboxylase/phosphopantothenate--cysteine ligase CoaBC [Alloprevotella sp.]